MCEPYVTQDGYDSGQLFVCDEHTPRGEPIIGEDGHQTYVVTLPMLTALVEQHSAQYAPA